LRVIYNTRKINELIIKSAIIPRAITVLSTRGCREKNIQEINIKEVSRYMRKFLIDKSIASVQ